MKFAGQQLPVLFSTLMSAILVHGYVPKSMLKSVIIPIIKNKNKRISDKDNYRPICLANVFTKVVEKVLYSRMDGYLQSTFNQFGFKRKHGTEMCVFVLKELIRYYINHGSCMYVAFLDASKVFDRVNHTKLFAKLLKLGVPKWIIKVLVQWYCNQSMCVRWGSAFSGFFLVNNGVRQGVFFPHYCLMYILTSSVSHCQSCLLVAAVVILLLIILCMLTILFYLLHQKRDCKRLSMCVMHMVVIMILYVIAQNHK